MAKRGHNRLSARACQHDDLTSETLVESGTPPTGSSWFHLVTAENLLREEGTKGWTSGRVERLDPAPCP